MKTAKIAITIPLNILQKIDYLAKKLHISRSKIMSEGAHEMTRKYEKQQLTDIYNAVYSDTDIQKEQSKMARSYLNLNNFSDEY